MIVAVEGPSAVGKTSWCKRNYPDQTVFEAPEEIVSPDISSDPEQAAEFWVGYDVKRWRRALAVEKATGLAVCDVDPLHIYYAWALWKYGEIDSTLFDLEASLYRDAIGRQEIGFPDRIWWLDAPLDVLRARARSDPSRRRKQHEKHLRISPLIKTWFEILNQFRPGILADANLGSAADESTKTPTAAQRYDLRLFDKALDMARSREPS